MMLSLAKLPPTIVGTVMAAADPFNSTKGLFDGWSGKFKLVATAAFALVLIVTGIAYAMGGNELKHGAKKKWLDVLIAACIVFGAVSGVAWLQGFLSQNGWN